MFITKRLLPSTILSETIHLKSCYPYHKDKQPIVWLMISKFITKTVLPSTSLSETMLLKTYHTDHIYKQYIVWLLSYIIGLEEL